MKNSPLGTIIDSFSIIVVAAGTIRQIDFLGLQAGYGISNLTGIANSLNVQITIIILLVICAAISSVTGIYKGIQILSSSNVVLAVGLIIGVLIFGLALFIFNNYFEAFGVYESV